MEKSLVQHITDWQFDRIIPLRVNHVWMILDGLEQGFVVQYDTGFAWASDVEAFKIYDKYGV